MIVASLRFPREYNNVLLCSYDHLHLVPGYAASISQSLKIVYSLPNFIEQAKLLSAQYVVSNYSTQLGLERPSLAPLRTYNAAIIFSLHTFLKWSTLQSAATIGFSSVSL
jgi:hypothetical protein